MEGPGGGFIEGWRAGRMEGLAETREMEQVKWEGPLKEGWAAEEWIEGVNGFMERRRRTDGWMIDGEVEG